MNEILISLATISFLATLALWYTIKERLRENDFEVDYFFHHLADIPNFVKLISREKNLQRKGSYLRIIILFFTSLLLLIISVLLTIVHSV